MLLHGCAVLDQSGHQRRGLELASRAYAIDPRFAGSYYAEMLISTGERDAARAIFDRDLARWPNVLFLNSNAVRFALEDRDWMWFDRVLRAMSPAVSRHPFIQLTLKVSRQLRAFTPAIAEEVLTQMRNAAAAGEAVFEILAGASFAHLFEPRGRLAYGEMGLNMLFTPLFAAMRRDLRFVDLCTKLGLAEYWAATGQWPDFAAEVAGRYDVAAETVRRLTPARSRAV